MVTKVKKKTTKRVGRKKKVLVNIVLDKSGSMHACLDATITGFNEYLQTLKKEAGDVHVTLTQFDSDKIDVVYNNRPLKEVKDLTRDNYVPGAMTPLYDAIGLTIKKADKVKDVTKICVIITDGYENASREYDLKAIKKLVQDREKKDWRFMYLGANQDAWNVSGEMGISRGNAATYTQTDLGTRAAFMAAAGGTSAMYMAVQDGADFSESSTAAASLQKFTDTSGNIKADDE